jgi:hypothetical protein
MYSRTAMSQPLTARPGAGRTSPTRRFASRRRIHDESTRCLAVIALPRRQRLRGRLLSRAPRSGIRRLGRAVVHLCEWVFLWTPPLAVLGASLWALFLAGKAFVRIVGLLLQLRLSEMGIQFTHVDLSGRVLLASAGYLAALLALRLMVYGLLQSGWRRLWLALGVVLALPGLWLMAAGVDLARDAASFALLPDWLWRMLVLVLLVHAVAFTVLTTDRRRGSLARADGDAYTDLAHLVDPDKYGAVPEAQETARMPILRFAAAGFDDGAWAETLAHSSEVRVPGLLHFFARPAAGGSSGALQRGARSRA